MYMTSTHPGYDTHMRARLSTCWGGRLPEELHTRMFYCEELERETDCCDYVQSQNQTDPHGIFFLIHITSIINVRKKEA